MLFFKKKASSQQPEQSVLKGFIVKYKLLRDSDMELIVYILHLFPQQSVQSNIYLSCLLNQKCFLYTSRIPIPTNRGDERQQPHQHQLQRLLLWIWVAYQEIRILFRSSQLPSWSSAQPPVAILQIVEHTPLKIKL